MPTTVTSTIGATSSPVTPDYTTLQAWEDACPANLVTDDKIWRGECLDQGEFVSAGTQLLIDGQTTDATRYVELTCAAGASFADKAGVRSTALDYNASNGVAIRTTDSYTWAVRTNVSHTRFSKLQIHASNTSGSRALIIGGAGTTEDTVTITDCILKCPVAVIFEAAPKLVANCLLIGGNAIQLSGNSHTYEFSNCTLIRLGATSGNGISGSYGTYIVKNCAIFNFTTPLSASSGGSFTGSDYNATDAATIAGGGGNNLTSLTFADQFESTTNDFRAVSTGDLQAGTPDSTYAPDDISDQDRDDTTPWIGCWEVAAAPPAGTILPIVNAMMMG